MSKAILKTHIVVICDVITASLTNSTAKDDHLTHEIIHPTRDELMRLFRVQQNKHILLNH